MIDFEDAERYKRQAGFSEGATRNIIEFLFEVAQEHEKRLGRLTQKVNLHLAEETRRKKKKGNK